jgi:DedD protein
MAKSISEEELQLRKRARRRLIGAIALVTIVAVFLPMVLDHEPRPVSQDISIRIPAPDSGIFTSKIVPVPPGAPTAKSTIAPAAPAKSESAQSEPPKTAAATPAAKQAAETPPAYDTEAAPPKKVVPEQPKPQAKPVPTLPAKSTPVPAVVEKPKAAQPAEAKGTGGFVVQVAALNDADKAKQIQEQIAAAGVISYTEVVPTAKGSVTRVRAGPFGSRDEADKMRDKLKGMGLNGNIVPK